MLPQLTQMLEYGFPGISGALVGGLLIALIFLLILCLLFIIGIYVYVCFALYALAKKLKYKKAWLAWIPFANLFLLPILAKWKWGYGFFLFIPIVNLVFAIIWCWEIYKKRKLPGALSLIKIGYLIPPLFGIALAADLIVLGIAAWEK